MSILAPTLALTSHNASRWQTVEARRTVQTTAVVQNKGMLKNCTALSMAWQSMSTDTEPHKYTRLGQCQALQKQSTEKSIQLPPQRH